MAKTKDNPAPAYLAYSRYHDFRRPSAATPVTTPARTRSGTGRRLLTIVVLAVLLAGGYHLVAQTGHTTQSPSKKSQPAVAATKPKTSQACAGNSLDQFVLVSISQRHLWACGGSKQLYDSPVVTGYMALPADLTPTGTFHVYAKITNTTLSGSDTTGSWNDPVYYWMPYLDNQYGTYGFHDATWRPDKDFGNVDPNSSDASHGCVELPLAAAKWLYGWGNVGLTVTVES